MTPDAEMAKLLGAVKAAGARAIIVGDYHQLDAVGPGAALEALARRRFRHYECPWGPAALVAGWSLTGTPSSRPADRHYCARAPVAGAQVYHRTHDRNSGCKGVRHD